MPRQCSHVLTKKVEYVSFNWLITMAKDATCGCRGGLVAPARDQSGQQHSLRPGAGHSEGLQSPLPTAKQSTQTHRAQAADHIQDRLRHGVHPLVMSRRRL